jgi:hypothetical protein
MHPFVLDGMTVESEPNSVSYINTDTRDMPWSLPVVRGILYTDLHRVISPPTVPPSMFCNVCMLQELGFPTDMCL